MKWDETVYDEGKKICKINKLVRTEKRSSTWRPRVKRNWVIINVFTELKAMRVHDYGIRCPVYN